MNLEMIKWKLSQLNRKRKYRKRLKEAKERVKYFRSFGVNGFGIVAETEYGYFVVGAEDDCVGKGILNGGGFPQQEINLLTSLLDKHSDVLIVGAHIGTLAIPISRLAKHVDAIEANPETFKFLSLNVAMNQISNCHVMNFAAAEKKGSIDFLMSRVNSGGSKRKPIKENIGYSFDNPEIVSVPARRLDDELKREKYDLVLMDIEGSEYPAMLGASELLSNARFFCVEFLPHHLKNVSGATFTQFSDELESHFEYMYVPKYRKSFGKRDFSSVLEGYYEKNDNHDLLVFSKSLITITEGLD
jgi:FkbM family methyltransferase